MNYSDFSCPVCLHFPLQLESEALVCPSCRASFPILADVPVLLPQKELAATVEGQQYTVKDIQKIYDKVYQHDGLMGTELDQMYDRETKGTLLSFAGDLRNKRLLDVGAGVGRLWEYAPDEVLGYALEPSNTGAARIHQKHPHLTVSTSVGEHLPYQDNFFDAVISADTIEHTFSPEQTLKEIHRVLKPGGVFGASFPAPNSLRKWGANQIIAHNFNPGYLLRLIQIVTKRFLLFGKANFQPIDRDFNIQRWVDLIAACGLEIKQVSEWPSKPQIPIVYLVHAKKP